MRLIRQCYYWIKISLQSLLNQQDINAEIDKKLSYAVLSFIEANNFANGQLVKQYIQASPDARLYARNLYADLRKLDDAGANYIIVEAPTDSPEWIAIADRLKRAATKLQSRIGR